VSKWRNPWVMLLLGLEIIGAFLLRTMGQWGIVFRSGQFVPRGTDSWYHLRLIESMLVNFPSHLVFDIYAAYPEGNFSGYHPLIAWVVYLTSKLGINYELAAALYPPIVGTLTLIPIYLIGEKLLNWKAGLIAAFFVAVIPSETFFRTLLGATDHHAFEIILMAWIIYFMVLAYYKVTWKSIIGFGLFLGLYVINWHGGIFIAATILIWYWLEFLLRLRDNKNTLDISKFLSLGGLLALVVSLPVVLISITMKEFFAMFFILIVGPIGIELLRRITKSKELFLFGLTVLIPIFFMFFDYFYSFMRLLGPSLWGYGSFIQEMDALNFVAFIQAFGILIFLAILGLIVLIRDKGNTVITSWSIIMLVFSLSQVRWLYYFTLCVAILSGYFLVYMLKWLKDNTRTAALVVSIVLSFSSIMVGTILATRVPDVMTSDWYNSMVWMGYNTPDPFTNKDTYYKLQTSELPSYGVLSWWDYGHWIIQIAHRVPLDSPTYSSSIPAQFLSSQSVEEANKYIENLNIKYIVIDKDIIGGKYYAIMERATKSRENWERLLRTSMAMKLWNGEAEGYKLIYQEGTVKIFEKLGP